MRKSGKGSGGGLGMNQNVRPGYKTGVGARGVNVKWPAQVGASRGNRVQGAEGGSGKVLKGVRADPYAGPSFRPAPMGNAVAAATVCRPGGSRTVMRSGAQGQHGSVNPGGAKHTDTRGQWPDSKR
jgi:hypothetical protein